MVKPDPRIYRLAADRLSLPIEECLFIDDKEPNVVAARELGMSTVHYQVDQGDNLALLLAKMDVHPHVERALVRRDIR